MDVVIPYQGCRFHNGVLPLDGFLRRTLDYITLLVVVLLVFVEESNKKLSARNGFSCWVVPLPPVTSSRGLNLDVLMGMKVCVAVWKVDLMVEE